ncbi:conserved hypothetical protein [Pseudomonas sp. OF001]|uniref:hypothetical protein n=1 Tax=Pseudomonas sp. OF001 TaxID=2772300 RepID=UPI001918DD84|nr:hypothetical protein [Pseudomonas sp. OF001]CAD5375350.1 conserved hypothetical protein [Pseudomonas sp. OF001]
MPIPPPPSTFRCTDCGWRRTVIPRSDALILGVDWFEHCPQCGSQTLQWRPASATETFKARLQQLLGGRH